MLTSADSNSTIDSFIKSRNVTDLEAELWPYAKEQHDKSILYLARLRHWKPLISELKAFLETYREAQAQILRESHRLEKFIEPENCEPDDKETLEITRPIYQGVQKYVGQQESFVKSIDNDLVKYISNFENDYSKNCKNFSNRMEKAFNSLRTERNNIIKLFESHFQSIDRIQHKKSTNSSLVDPWLSEKIISEKMKTAVDIENQNRLVLIELHQQIKLYELQVIETLKRIVPTFIVTVGSSEKRICESLQNLDYTLKSVDGEKSFQAYTKRLGLDNADCFHKKEEVPWVFDKDAYLKEILKKGILERPGTFRKHVFKNSLYVLTNNGFLHCFNVKAGKDENMSMENIQYSIYLKTPKLTVVKSNINVNCIEINVPVIPKPIFGAHEIKYILKAKSEEEMDGWIDALSEHLLQNRSRPEVLEDV